MNPQSLQPALNIQSLANLGHNYQSFNSESLSFVPSLDMNYQMMFLRAQALRAMQMRNMQLKMYEHDAYQTKVEIKEELSQKVEENSSQYSSQYNSEPKSETLSVQTQTTIPGNSIMVNGQPWPEQVLFMELKKLVDFILFNMGKNNRELIESTRNYYSQNPCFLQIYDKLVMKYYSAKKCKEDMIRYILRKVFRAIRTSIMKKENVSSKKATAILYKTYFESTDAKLESLPGGVEDEDGILNFFMPEKRDSKVKTMNTGFVLKIFSSASFYQVYQQYLPELNRLLVEDNEQRKEKFLKFLMSCIKNDCISKLGLYTRLPWLDVWINDTKNVAIGIMPNKRLIYNHQKQRF